MKNKANRRCAACTRGVIEPDGYAADNRPQYKCSNCGQTHTKGHGGHQWDARQRYRVRADCTCETCTTSPARTG